MTNHPNRSRYVNRNAINVVVRRTAWNVVEYTVTSEEYGAEDVRTYHANREATFFDRHTGRGNARQLSGVARTLWRETDAEMLAAFRRDYPNAEITIEK